MNEALRVGKVRSLGPPGGVVLHIYREGGILKRLRATPLRPQTILSAHVLVKLLLTAVTLMLMMLAGKRYYPVDVVAPVFSFALAVVFAAWFASERTLSIHTIYTTRREFFYWLAVLFTAPMTYWVFVALLAANSARNDTV